MCIVPTDTSDCTHVMHRGASAAGNDGYAGIGPSRYPTRAAAWTHIPAGKKRSSLNSIGTSNGASGGQTPVPKTPAEYLPRRSKRSIPPTTAAKSVDPPGTGRSRKKRRRRKRSDAAPPTTDAETTVEALASWALGAVKPGGHVSVAIYPGHPAGAREAVALRAFAERLPSSAWRATAHAPVNHEPTAPLLLSLHRLYREPPFKYAEDDFAESIKASNV